MARSILDPDLDCDGRVLTVTEDIFQALGGLGLFLLGMVVMTDGLKGLAGNLLRRSLMRFTRSPLSGALTGTISTAILQSSSATTVATVGFVGAGLLTFPHALGIIFGANIGTTVTGWLVALLGFKLKLGTIASPLILLGMLLRLFGRGKLPVVGMALAGFGLIFVGISLLQQGMVGFQKVVTPDSFPADSLGGRLCLVALGLGLTLVTHSSSAGVALSLSALHAGAISFHQAAAMVIGMDVGTSVTALMAALGGSVESRRTGYSHVIFNLFTGVAAFFLLTPYVWVWGLLNPDGLRLNPEIALVGFHSGFNILGVIIVLPFSHRFARMVERLVRGRVSYLSSRLDDQLLKESPVAIDAVSQTLREIALVLFEQARQAMDDRDADTEVLEEMSRVLDDTGSYVDRVHLGPRQNARSRLLAAIHALDHLRRLHERCLEESDRAKTVRETPGLAQLGAGTANLIGGVIADIRVGEWSRAMEAAEMQAEKLRDLSELQRELILADVAVGTIGVPLGTDRLEGTRWLQRVTDHVWRISLHLRQMQQARPNFEQAKIESHEQQSIASDL